MEIVLKLFQIVLALFTLGTAWYLLFRHLNRAEPQYLVARVSLLLIIYFGLFFLPTQEDTGKIGNLPIWIFYLTEFYYHLRGPFTGFDWRFPLICSFMHIVHALVAIGLTKVFLALTKGILVLIHRIRKPEPKK